MATYDGWADRKQVEYQHFLKCQRCGSFIRNHTGYCDCGSQDFVSEVIGLDVLESYGYFKNDKAEASKIEEEKQMSYRDAGFGFLYIKNYKGDPELVRMGKLDIRDIKNQAMAGEKHCRIREDDGFCQSSWTSSESAREILLSIMEHDNKYLPVVKNFAERNRFVMIKGEIV